MSSTIIIKNSATSGSVPASLVQGEFGINVTDGKLYYGSGSGNVVKEFNTSSFALTASYLNPLNQTVLLTGSLLISGSEIITGSLAISGSGSLLTVEGDEVTISGDLIEVTGSLRVTGSIAITNFSQGSVLFIGSNGNLTQDNSNFFWNDTTNRLSIGTSTTNASLYLKGPSNTASDTLLRVENSSSTGRFVVDGTGRASIGADPSTIRFQVSGSGSEALFLVGSSLSASILFVTGSGRVGIGTNNPLYTLDVSGSSNFRGDTIITGSFTVITGSSIELQVLNTGVKIGNLITDIHTVTGSLSISGSISASSANFGTITATSGSITYLTTIFETSSVIYSSGSNQFGDASNDTQTLWGTVDIKTGPVLVTGSASISGSLNVSSSFTASGLRYPTADNGEFSFIQTDGNGNLSLKYVNTLYETIYNGETSSLAKGTPVYVSGSQGANSIVYRADAGNPAKMPVIYIAADNIGPSSTGRGIVLGLITGVDTTGYPGGTEIFVAAGGGWTSTRPTGSAIVQVLGIVTKEGNGGQGVVLNPGPANLPNLPSGSVWVGNSASFPTATPTSSLSVASASFALTASYVAGASSFPYTGSALITGSLGVTGSLSVLGLSNFRQNATVTGSLQVAGQTRISGSFNTAISGTILTVVGSGSTQPIFTVQGSQGELFSVTDSLSGSLFSVNDISGLPILEVFSDSTTTIGNYLSPAVYTTNKITQTNSGSFVVYSLPTASYDGAFYDYTVRSGSNARAGQIMAIWSGSSVNFTETTTTSFGSTSAINFTVHI